MVKMDFGGVKEDVITRKEFTVAQAQKILKDEVVVSLGYGIQGRAQSLNMRDNGIKVIIGQEKEGIFKKEWDKAVADGWVPGENLFPLGRSSQKRNHQNVPTNRRRTKSSMAKNQSHPQNRRRTLLQPRIQHRLQRTNRRYPTKRHRRNPCCTKRLRHIVRRNFVDGSGINCSFAVFQDATGKAEERAKALGIADRRRIPVPNNI